MKSVALSLCLALLVSCNAAPEEAAVPATPDPGAEAASVDESDPEQARHRRRPKDDEIVYYRLHPQDEKIDRYCGARERSYVVKHVDVGGNKDVLSRALQALFTDYWGAPKTLGSVSIEGGRATVELRSTEGVGFASTSCGGVGFLGSVLRTVFQFGHIDMVELRLRGSCRDFGKFMQSGVCEVFNRRDVALVTRRRDED